MKDPIRVKAGKKSKNKGSNNERAIAKLFEAYWGHGTWARTPGSGGWSTSNNREAFRTCGDIITTATDFPFCIELKKQEGWTLDQLLHNEKCIIYQWWEQTITATPAGLVPLLIVARNHHLPVAIFHTVHVKQLIDKVGEFNKAKEPILPWEIGPHFKFNQLLDSDWTIVPLISFFRCNPDYFGRKLPNVIQRTNQSGQIEIEGQIVVTGTNDSEV